MQKKKKNCNAAVWSLEKVESLTSNFLFFLWTGRQPLIVCSFEVNCFREKKTIFQTNHRWDNSPAKGLCIVVTPSNIGGNVWRVWSDTMGRIAGTCPLSFIVSYIFITFHVYLVYLYTFRKIILSERNKKIDGKIYDHNIEHHFIRLFNLLFFSHNHIQYKIVRKFSFGTFWFLFEKKNIFFGSNSNSKCCAWLFWTKVTVYRFF